VNVFDLGNDGLLIRPVKPPGKEVIARLLQQTPVGRQSPKQAEAIVNEAVRQVRG
jgi:hypothetical protein